MTCPACRSADVIVAETLDTRELAAHWARLAMHGDATPAEIEGFVRGDIGSDTVQILTCRACRLEFAEPRHTWRAAHYPHEAHELGWDHEEALRALAPLPPGTLLDVGCANGQFLARAAALGHRVTGIDFSEEDIAECRRQGFEAHVADLRRDNALLADARRFDVITLFQVIEHLEEPDLVFEGLGKLAAPGARLMLGCPSSLRYTRGFGHPQLVGSSDFWDSPPQHVLRWNPAALTAFLARHGWRVTATAFEPLRAFHAAAHLAGFGDATRSRWQRRMSVAAYYLRLKAGHRTGIRLFAEARN